MLATVKMQVNGKIVEHGPYDVYSLDRIYGDVILSDNGHLFVDTIENVRLLEKYIYKQFCKYRMSDMVDQLKEATNGAH